MNLRPAFFAICLVLSGWVASACVADELLLKRIPVGLRKWDTAAKTKYHSATVKEALQSAGVSFPEGSFAIWVDSTNQLVVRNTAENIRAVERAWGKMIDTYPVPMPGDPESIAIEKRSYWVKEKAIKLLQEVTGCSEPSEMLKKIGIPFPQGASASSYHHANSELVVNNTPTNLDAIGLLWDALQAAVADPVHLEVQTFQISTHLLKRWKKKPVPDRISIEPKEDGSPDRDPEFPQGGAGFWSEVGLPQSKEPVIQIVARPGENVLVSDEGAIYAIREGEGRLQVTGYPSTSKGALRTTTLGDSFLNIRHCFMFGDTVFLFKWSDEPHTRVLRVTVQPDRLQKAVSSAP